MVGEERGKVQGWGEGRKEEQGYPIIPLLPPHGGVTSNNSLVDIHSKYKVNLTAQLLWFPLHIVSVCVCVRERERWSVCV